VRRDRLVPLLVSAVLPDVPQVVPPDDNGSGHLRRHNDTLEDAPSDADIAREGALFVNVCALQEEQTGGLGAGFRGRRLATMNAP
jgi:hypothetical protein